MPELPEVESARLVLEKAARGRTIAEVNVHPDALVFDRNTPAALKKALKGSKVVGTGRRGKYFWAELDRRPWPWFHFGMSGSLHVYREPDERPNHWKLEVILSDGKRLAWRDPRRFGRIRLVADPLSDPRLARLGFDPLLDMPSLKEWGRLLKKRKKNLKALLLDQTFSAGVGNWIADEVLYHARLAPRRMSTDLSAAEVKALRQSLLKVIRTAVRHDADSEKFPWDWLFRYRWSARHTHTARDTEIVRETIAGRTTVWVPEEQG